MSTTPDWLEPALQAINIDDAGRVCKDIPKQACREEGGNFLRHVVSLGLTKTADGLMELFRELNTHHNTTFVIATHDKRVMSYAKRLVRMLDGRIVDDINQDAA